MLSLTESSIVAARMAKLFAAELIWMRENRIHPESDLGPEEHRAIMKVAAELDIRRVDVVRSRSVGRNSLQRQITIKLAFGRTTAAKPSELNTAVGTLVVDNWGFWEPYSGQVAVEFHDGHKMNGLETEFGPDASHLPPL